MPTFYEIEEIKQAQVQALLQVKARAEANLGGTPENKESGANILISPFGSIEKEKKQATGGSDTTASSPRQSTQSVASHPADSESGFDLAFSGMVFLVGCVLLYLMLRRMWD